jgi:hypothetical protein
LGPEETASGAHYKLVCGACAVGGPGVLRYGNSRYSGEPHFIRFANLQSPWPDGAGAAETCQRLDPTWGPWVSWTSLSLQAHPHMPRVTS